MSPTPSRRDLEPTKPIRREPILLRLRASIGQLLSDMAAYPPPPINPYMPTVGFPGVARARPPMGQTHTL